MTKDLVASQSAEEQESSSPSLRFKQTRKQIRPAGTYLFIAGEKDVMMPPERVEENSKLVPEAKFVVIPKMGHMFFNREIEKQVGDVILHHLASKKICRKYGKAPFTVAVIHGGPGRAGEVAPVARKLSSCCGVLEPLQTEDSLEGQVQELRETLRQYTERPVTLIGYSWGAWLSYIVTARYPSLVGKLIRITASSSLSSRPIRGEQLRFS